MDRTSDAYEQDYFSRVRRRTFGIQSMAPLALLVVAAVDAGLTGTAIFAGGRWVPLLAGMAAIGVLMVALARISSIPAHGLATMAMLCAAELSIAFIVTPTRESLYWVMPIMLVIPVAAAPFWIRYVRVIASCVLCCACAGVLLARVGVDSSTVLVFLAQSVLLTCTSLAINGSIDRLRRSAYEFQVDLDHQAKHDALTGLLSRRRFLELGEEVTRAVLLRDQSYAVCFMDLDRFKDINDVHGHAAGDRALSRIAELLLAHLPAGAQAARMGGEEFVMLLPGFDTERARELAESLRVALESLSMDGFTLTTSAGVAEHHPGESLKQTLHRADSALLAAKQRGRNRVETAGD